MSISVRAAALSDFTLIRRVLGSSDHALETQPALACRIGQRLDAAVIEIMAAVEHHWLDALGGGAFRTQLADRLGGADIGAGLEARPQVLFERGCGGDRRARLVVDHLGVDVFRRAKHRQAQTQARRRLDGASDARLAPFDLLTRHGRLLWPPAPDPGNSQVSRTRSCAHQSDELHYFFLPSLRKMYSPEYLTPLPS